MRSVNHLIPSIGRASNACRVPHYRVVDRLHDGRTARVALDGIASTVSAWLAELGASSPLVDQLACAVRCGDWPAAHALAENLSIDVVVD